MSAHRRQREVVFQTRETTQDPDYGTTIEGDWVEAFTDLADVQDTRPGRQESIADGISLSTRTALITMRFRDDITSSMRVIVKGRGTQEADRVMRIISAPAEIQNTGFRQECEFLAEEISTTGQEP